MSCQKLSRQSLHLVLSEGRGLYSFRHMDISKLFYPSTADALEADAKAKMKKNGINKIGSLGRLPRPSIHYQPFMSVVSNPYSSISLLALFGERKNKILCSDTAGNASIYNTELRSLIAIPELNSPKGLNSVAVSIPGATAPHGRSDFDDHTDSLYIIDMNHAGSEVLSYDPVESWCWDPLPRPPFLKEPNYKAHLQARFTVVDNSRICVSSTTATYCFDTVTREWNKMGDWVLPFEAVYAPELGLWFGLSSDGDSYDLCALDNLSTAVGSSAPTVQHIGKEFELPDDSWWLVTCHLVNLGSRKFCIAGSFMIENDQDEYNSVPVTVFTGVEVLPGEQGLRMVKHKSKCFLTGIRVVL